MATIRDPATATANWVARAGAASGFYGTRVAGATWKAAASSPQAEANYAAGVQQAITAKSRLAGVNASTDAEWQAGVASVGVGRYAQGVASAAPRMSAAMGKLIPAMSTIIQSLPASGPRGSSANITRATQFMTKLAAQRGQFKSYGVARTG
jgi:hypothetical protein